MNTRCVNKALGIALAGCFSFVASVVFSQTPPAPHDSMEWAEAVGPAGPNRVVLPINQVLTPAGKQVGLRKLRPQVLALSPDGKLLVTSGKSRQVVALDPDSGNVLQTVALPDDALLDPAPDPVSPHMMKPDKNEQVSYTGLVFSPDGSRLYLSNVKGSIKVFSVGADHRLKGLGSIALPDADACGWQKLCRERKLLIPGRLSAS